MIILSLDSGIEKTGWAIMSLVNDTSKLIDYGLISTSKKDSLPKRLFEIGEQIDEILTRHPIEIAVLEQLFFNTNVTTGIQVAQAQGVVISRIEKNKISTNFVTPLFVKQTITGYGRADKKQVLTMIKLLLRGVTLPTQDDIIDAIAVGLAFSRIVKYKQL